MRKCGVCELGLRDGQMPEPIRVGAEGADLELLKALKIEGRTVAPGLYAACPDCVTTLKPSVCVRVKKQREKEERILALTEERPERKVPDVQPADLTANDLC